MTHPQWILVAWAVFLGAVALKVWQFGKALKRPMTGATPSSDQFSQTLERIWAQEPVEAQWRT